MPSIPLGGGARQYSFRSPSEGPINLYQFPPPANLTPLLDGRISEYSPTALAGPGLEKVQSASGFRVLELPNRVGDEGEPWTPAVASGTYVLPVLENEDGCVWMGEGMTQAPAFLTIPDWVSVGNPAGLMIPREIAVRDRLTPSE